MSDINYITHFITPFDGSKDQYERFMESVDRSMREEDDKTKRIILKHVLMVLHTLQFDFVVTHEINSWRQVKDLMRDHFNDELCSDKSFRDLIELDSSLFSRPFDLAVKCDSIAYKYCSAIYEETDDKNEVKALFENFRRMIVKKFINGLDEKMKYAIFVQNPKTLAEAYDYYLLCCQRNKLNLTFFIDNFKSFEEREQIDVALIETVVNKNSHDILLFTEYGMENCEILHTNNNLLRRRRNQKFKFKYKWKSNRLNSVKVPFSLVDSSINFTKIVDILNADQVDIDNLHISTKQICYLSTQTYKSNYDIGEFDLISNEFDFQEFYLDDNETIAFNSINDGHLELTQIVSCVPENCNDTFEKIDLNLNNLFANNYCNDFNCNFSPVLAGSENCKDYKEHHFDVEVFSLKNNLKFDCVRDSIKMKDSSLGIAFDTFD